MVLLGVRRIITTPNRATMRPIVREVWRFAVISMSLMMAMMTKWSAI